MGAPRGISLAGHLPLPLGSGHVPWPQLQALTRCVTKSGEMPFTCFSCFLSILPSWLGDRQCGRGARSASLACPLRPAGLGRSPTLSLSRFGGRGCGHRSQEQEITPKGDKACNPKWVGFQDQSPWGMRRGGERLGGPRPTCISACVPVARPPAGWEAGLWPLRPSPPLGQPWLSPSPQQDTKRSARHHGLSPMEQTRAEPVQTVPGPAFARSVLGPRQVCHLAPAARPARGPQLPTLRLGS